MLKEAWKDPVWGNVIATLIGTTILSIVGYFQWTTIVQVSNRFTSFAQSATTIDNWVLGLIALTTALTGVLSIIFIKSKFSKPKKKMEEWREYKKDAFSKLLWRWDYFNNGKIYNLTTYCPHCDYELVPDVLSRREQGRVLLEFMCEDCNMVLTRFDEAKPDYESKITRLIEQKIRAGTWPRESKKRFPKLFKFKQKEVSN